MNPATGFIVDSRCTVEQRKKVWVAWWPSVLEPWLPHDWTRAGLLPGVDPGCPHQIEAVQGALLINSIEPNAVYVKNYGQGGWPVVGLQASGGRGSHHWYINGRHLGSVPAGTRMDFATETTGRFQVLVSDDFGNVDKLSMAVIGR